MKGFVPKIPQVASGSDNGPMVIIAGMVGTTVSIFAFLIRSGQVKEHGWTMADWKMQKRDALVSATMMFVLSAAVLITAAATLHKTGQSMNKITEMIPMLKPLFGTAALGIFVIGILAAGISSHLPNTMVIPWLTDDMFAKPHVLRSKGKIIALGVLTIISMMGAMVDRPVFLLLLSQAGISVVMPLGLLGLMYLASRKDVLPTHRPKPWEWVVLGLIACFSLYMGCLAIQGLVEDITQLFS